jgi:hypothetical protein
LAAWLRRRPPQEVARSDCGQARDRHAETGQPSPHLLDQTAKEPLSSRAEISATRLINVYSFGDFRGDPGRLLEEYMTVRFRWDDENLEDEAEPPVPAGPKELSDSLASVAEFLKIDDDLIEAAADPSGPLVPVSDDGSRTGSRRCQPARKTSSSRWSQRARRPGGPGGRRPRW